jgi:thiamine biosynthesis lipoprotein
MQPSLQAAEQSRVRRARPLLGTRVEIEVGGGHDAVRLHAAVDAAFACIERVHQLMSYQNVDSDLSRLNEHALAGAHAVHPHTYRVCEAALQFARSSAGAFDPTVAARAGGDWRDIELCGENHIRFHRPLKIDLGGIAKGYAVDLAVEVLQSLQMERVLVNAGGDMRVAGPVPQVAHLRHPEVPLQSAHTLLLQNAALATSAAYFSRQASPRGEDSALIDARSGEPYLGGRSVSVRTLSCTSADALTKVVLFAPAALATACLAAHGAQAYVMEPH